jgi:cell division protein FtsB
MLLLVAGLLLASAFVAIEIQRNALGRQAAAYRADIAVAEARYAKLGADVAAKTTDDYVMNRAHDYGYVRPGEALIGVQQPATTPDAVTSAPVPSRARKWLALFFGSR